MHFIAPSLLFVTLASASAHLPAINLVARATSDASSSACASSITAITSSFPSPTDKALSSWIAGNTGTATEFSIPSSLTSAFCTYDASAASWASASLRPFVSKCSSYLDPEEASLLSVLADEGATTSSFCSTVTGKKGNAAAPRETGGLVGVVAAVAGVAAVML